MTNKIYIKGVPEIKCSFCGEPETKRRVLFIGSTGAAMCEYCLTCIRVEMGLDKPKSAIEQAIDNAR